MNAPTGNPRNYDDMVGLGHHVSRTQSPMARIKCAAHFTFFATLTGFGAAIHKAGWETKELIKVRLT